jgi:diadenylate cyclase
MLDDVLVVVQRAEMTTRMADEVERDIAELGTEGRMIRIQLSELMEGVLEERRAVVFDYGGDSSREEILARLADLSYAELLESELLAEVLGYDRTVNPLDYAVSPRGYRVLSRIPRLPRRVVESVVGDLEGLEAIVRASRQELEEVEGVGPARAREIREGLRRLQEHNLVDRYLQL